jgi:starvation-inducible DNA-binding protein
MKTVVNKTTKTNTVAQHPLVGLLNQSLATMIDLKLQSKQAHWNVKGGNFIALHQLFDDVAGAVDGYVDLLAERVVQLGGTAEGRVQPVGDASLLKVYPDVKDSAQHVAALAAAIHIAAQQTRKLIDKAGDTNDEITADICTEITRGLDKWHWFVASHSA